MLSVDDGVSKQTYDQQQALVNQLKATAQGNQAAIDAAQVQLSYTRIRSPVTGRVGIRNVDEGNFLRTSDTEGLFTVTQIDPIAVEFALPQQMLPTLQRLIAAPEQALVKAYIGADGATGELLGEGRLSLIDNQINANTGTLRAKAEFNNAAPRLWPGQLVPLKISNSPSTTVKVSSSRVWRCGGGPPPGGLTWVTTATSPSLVLPSMSTSTCSSKTGNDFKTGMDTSF